MHDTFSASKMRDKKSIVNEARNESEDTQQLSHLLFLVGGAQLENEATTTPAQHTACRYVLENVCKRVSRRSSID